MIIAYTGMPGGGKTYALVYRAYKALKQGRTVFANFPLKGCYQITLDDICNYRFPEDCVVLIDEAGRWFNSRQWKDLPSEVFDLFTMHRHVKMDLYIAVQSFARIDKSLREVVELTYWSRNPSFLPWHKYEGFYDLEKVGSMKRDYHVAHIVWKKNLLRNMYDTFSMKSKFADKELIYYVPWSRMDKTKMTIRIQKIRVTRKKIIRPIKRFIKDFIEGMKGGSTID